MNGIILPDNVTEFMQVFKKNGYEIYVVGGAIRDLLLGKTTENWDFTTNATPEQIRTLFPDNFYHNIYGTVSVPTKDKEKPLIFEVTPYRHEGNYVDNRHPEEISWAKTIEEDVSRRDFTINSIAYDGKNIIDIYHGIHDINRNIVKTVGEADKRFSEDGLRLLRAARIATQLQFEIDEETATSIKKNAPLLKNISAERIRDEFLKIIASNYPSEGILLLKNLGLLRFIIPELDESFNTPQISPKRHHIYDVGTHMIMSLKHCASKDPIVRLACLLHDIGKPITFAKDPETQIITFYNHEIEGAKIVKRIAQDLRLSRKDGEKLYQLVRYHQFTVSELQTDKAVRRFIRELGKENVDDMLALREADRVGSGSTPTSWRFELFKKRIVEVQKEPFKVTDLKITGKDLMDKLNIPPGPKVGDILTTLFNEVVDKKIENTHEALIKRLADFEKELIYNK